MVRSGKHPLPEIVRRIIEQESLIESKMKQYDTISHDNVLSKPIDFDCITFKQFGNAYTVHDKIIFHDFKITPNDPDKWFLTKHNEIVSFKCAVLFKDGNEMKLFMYGSAIEKKRDLFTKPISSSSLFIFATEKKMKPLQLFSADEIVCKLFHLRYAGDYNDIDESSESEIENVVIESIFIPLWHTLK